MPRTTLDIDPVILDELRQRAEREGKSMGQLVTELLAPVLKENGARDAEPFTWESWNMGGYLVDIEDRDAVQRILDDDAGYGR